MSFPVIVIQIIQNPEKVGILRSQDTQRHNTAVRQEKVVFLITDFTVTAQTEGVYIKTFDKGTPAANLDAVVCADRQMIFDQCDIAGSSAHVNDDRLWIMSQVGTAHNAGSRTAQQCFYRMVEGISFVHQRTVAAHNDYRII